MEYFYAVSLLNNRIVGYAFNLKYIFGVFFVYREAGSSSDIIFLAFKVLYVTLVQNS